MLVAGEFSEPVGKLIQRHRGKLRLLRRSGQDGGELGQAGVDCPIETVDLRQARRHRGVPLGGGVLRPEGALFLYLDEGLVQVRDMDAGPHILLGNPAQPRPGHRAHFDGPLPAPGGRGRRRDQVGHGPVEDIRGELVEAGPHSDQQIELAAPLLERGSKLDVRVVRNRTDLFLQQRDVPREVHCQSVRLFGFLAVAELRTEPGALGRFPAEPAQLGGAPEPRGKLRPVRNAVHDAALEPDGCSGGRIERGQLGKGLHGLVGRAPPA